MSLLGGGLFGNRGGGVDPAALSNLARRDLQNIPVDLSDDQKINILLLIGAAEAFASTSSVDGKLDTDLQNVSTSLTAEQKAAFRRLIGSDVSVGIGHYLPTAADGQIFWLIKSSFDWLTATIANPSGATYLVGLDYNFATGDLWAADTNSEKVYVMRHGASTWDATTIDFHTQTTLPQDISVARDGKIYIPDPNNDFVYIYDPVTSAWTTEAFATDMDNVHGFSIDSQGRQFAMDYVQRRIYIRPADAANWNTGRTDFALPAGVTDPSNITHDENDILYLWVEGTRRLYPYVHGAWQPFITAPETVGAGTGLAVNRLKVLVADNVDDVIYQGLRTDVDVHLYESEGGEWHDHGPIFTDVDDRIREIQATDPDRLMSKMAVLQLIGTPITLQEIADGTGTEVRQYTPQNLRVFFRSHVNDILDEASYELIGDEWARSPVLPTSRGSSGRTIQWTGGSGAGSWTLQDAAGSHLGGSNGTDAIYLNDTYIANSPANQQGWWLISYVGDTLVDKILLPLGLESEGNPLLAFKAGSDRKFLEINWAHRTNNNTNIELTVSWPRDSDIDELPANSTIRFYPAVGSGPVERPEIVNQNIEAYGFEWAQSSVLSANANIGTDTLLSPTWTIRSAAGTRVKTASGKIYIESNYEPPANQHGWEIDVLVGDTVMDTVRLPLRGYQTYTVSDQSYQYNSGTGANDQTITQQDQFSVLTLSNDPTEQDPPRLFLVWKRVRNNYGRTELSVFAPSDNASALPANTKLSFRPVYFRGSINPIASRSGFGGQSPSDTGTTQVTPNLIQLSQWIRLPSGQTPTTPELAALGASGNYAGFPASLWSTTIPEGTGDLWQATTNLRRVNGVWQTSDPWRVTRVASSTVRYVNILNGTYSAMPDENTSIMQVWSAEEQWVSIPYANDHLIMQQTVQNSGTYGHQHTTIRIPFDDITAFGIHIDHDGRDYYDTIPPSIIGGEDYANIPLGNPTNDNAAVVGVSTLMFIWDTYGGRDISVGNRAFSQISHTIGGGFHINFFRNADNELTHVVVFRDFGLANASSVDPIFKLWVETG